MVALTFKLSTWEVEAMALSEFKVQGQSSPQSKFQVSQGCIVDHV